MANPARKDIPVELTWDLSLIYSTEEEMFEDCKKIEEISIELEKKYKGNLYTAENINACLDTYREMEKLCVWVMHYVDLAVAVDYYDAYNNQRYGQVMNRLSTVSARLSFIQSEITEQKEEIIEEAIAHTEANKGFLKDLLRFKPYTLQPETEKVLTALGQTLETPYQVYNSLKLADMHFNSFEVNGKEYPNSYTLFEDNYTLEEDADVRRAAFKNFSDKIREYENGTATAYNAQVQKEKTLATLRGFDSVFDYLLFNQKVTREMYNRQIDLITTKLAPHMRKYAKLLQKVHHLDKMTFADLKIALDPQYDPRVSIPEAKEYVKKGLSVLGEDYVAMVEEAFSNRWIDFAQNAGKSTGGFCASPYGKNSYILLSFNNRMADVFTLAHELGHAGHFKACNAAQSIFDTDVSTYFVEAPSTMNELIMGTYLLKTSDDPRFKRWVLSAMISNTYYHNFVTHLLEADYQRKVYELVDKGESVNAELLNQLKRETLENFWGDAVEINEGAELTWMRQGHYYMGLYSYTYSAGLTVATEACRKIEEEGQIAVNRWKEVLKAGSILDPIGLAALADIDITTEQPLLNTIDHIGEMIEEICQLTEQIEKD